MYNKTYFNNSSVLENQNQIFSTLYAMGFVRVCIYVPQSEIFCWPNSDYHCFINSCVIDLNSTREFNYYRKTSILLIIEDCELGSK